jgi:hypothetical protein
MDEGRPWLNREAAKSKKLVDAGYYWATPTEVRDVASVEEDLDAFGAPPEIKSKALARLAGENQKSTFVLWEENEPAYRAFQNLRTQLRTSGMGQVTGLDYTAVISYLEFTEIADKHALFEELQLIESGVLKSVNEQAKRQKRNR